MAVLAATRFTNRFLSKSLEHDRAVLMRLTPQDVDVVNAASKESAAVLHTKDQAHLVPKECVFQVQHKLAALRRGDADVLAPITRVRRRRTFGTPLGTGGAAFEDPLGQEMQRLRLFMLLLVGVLYAAINATTQHKERPEPEQVSEQQVLPSGEVHSALRELPHPQAYTLNRILVQLLDAAKSFDSERYGNGDDLMLLTGLSEPLGHALRQFRQRMGMEEPVSASRYDAALDAQMPVRILTGMPPVRAAVGGRWHLRDMPGEVTPAFLAGELEPLPFQPVHSPKLKMLTRGGSMHPNLFVAALQSLREAFPKFLGEAPPPPLPAGGAPPQPPAAVASDFQNLPPAVRAQLPNFNHDLRVLHFRMRLRAREAAARTQAAALLTQALQRAWESGADVAPPLGVKVPRQRGRDRVCVLVAWPGDLERSDKEQAEASAVPDVVLDTDDSSGTGRGAPNKQSAAAASQPSSADEAAGSLRANLAAVGLRPKGVQGGTSDDDDDEDENEDEGGAGGQETGSSARARLQAMRGAAASSLEGLMQRLEGSTSAVRKAREYAQQEAADKWARVSTAAAELVQRHADRVGANVPDVGGGTKPKGGRNSGGTPPELQGLPEARSPDWDELHKRLLALPQDSTQRYDSTRLVAPAPAVPALGSMTAHRRLLRSAKGIRKLMSSEHAVMNFIEREAQLRMWLGGVPFALQWALRKPNQEAYPLLDERIDRAWIDTMADVWCENKLEPEMEVPTSSRGGSGWLASSLNKASSGGGSSSNGGSSFSGGSFGGSTSGRGGAGASW